MIGESRNACLRGMRKPKEVVQPPPHVGERRKAPDVRSSRSTGYRAPTDEGADRRSSSSNRSNVVTGTEIENLKSKSADPNE